MFGYTYTYSGDLGIRKPNPVFPDHLRVEKAKCKISTEPCQRFTSDTHIIISSPNITSRTPSKTQYVNSIFPHYCIHRQSFRLRCRHSIPQFRNSSLQPCPISRRIKRPSPSSFMVRTVCTLAFVAMQSQLCFQLSVTSVILTIVMVICT